MLTCKKVCNCVQPSLDGVSDHFKRKFRIAAFRLCNLRTMKFLNVFIFNVKLCKQRQITLTGRERDPPQKKKKKRIITQLILII